jgi:hypothetical protein
MNEASGDDDTCAELFDGGEHDAVDPTEGKFVHNHGQKDRDGAGGEHSKQGADSEWDIVITGLS